MNALYNTCWADPWIKVAQRLDSDKNIRAAYWIGFYDDGSEQDVPAAFPNIVYHSRWDAWKGIFSPEIEACYTRYRLNPDWLKSIARYELIAIAAMDRMDPDRHSFPFAERQRLFRNLLRKWLACIDRYKLQVVISDRIPHRSYDYALYLVCEWLEIPFLFFQRTFSQSRSLVRFKVTKPDRRLRNAHQRNSQEYARSNLQEIASELAPDALESFKKGSISYEEAKPDYMHQHAQRQRKNASIFSLGANFLLDFLNLRNKKEVHRRRNRGLLCDFLDIHPYAKKRHRSIEDSKYNAFQYGLVAYKAIRYKAKLKKHYERHAIAPDLTKPYIYFPLHYQPEATSNPSGDLFTDQYLAIEQMASVVPDGWQVYVKEHAPQFYTVTEGQKARFRHLYDDLLKIPNVHLVSLNSNPFALVDNAQGVATLTGTVAWEAICRRKPVIVFGLSWCEACPGVLRIRHEEDIRHIPAFLSGYSYDERAVLLYLLTIQQQTPLTYGYMAKAKSSVSEQDCIRHLLEQIEAAMTWIREENISDIRSGA